MSCYLRGETSASHVRIDIPCSLSHDNMMQKLRYACMYLVLSATYQVKAVRELT